MPERGMRPRPGGFVAGALAALAGLALFLGVAPELFSNKARYVVLFPDASGVAPGTPVRKSGVRVGEVTALDLDPESGQVRVRLRVDRKFLPRQTEVPTIPRGLLGGDASIDFMPKLGEDGLPVPRGEEWPPDSDIPGAPPTAPRNLFSPGALSGPQQSLDRLAKALEVLEKFQSVQPKLERALDEASETFRAVRGLVPGAQKSLDRFHTFLGGDSPPGGVIPAGGLVAAQPPAGDANLPALIRDIQEVARAARPAIEDLRAMVRRLEPEVTGAVKSAKTTFDSVNEILSPENRKQLTELLKNANAVAVSVVKVTNSLTTILDGAEKTLKNVDTVVTAAGGVVTDVRAVTKPLAAKSEVLVASVTESAEQLAKALAEVRGLLAAFGKGNGTVQKLLSDPNVYQNLDEAAASIARIMARAEKIARDLEVFADKIARRPELIGVGGAVRPSSGLKDSPGAPLPAYRPDWPPATTAPPDWFRRAEHDKTSGPNWLLPPVQGYPPR